VKIVIKSPDEKSKALGRTNKKKVQAKCKEAGSQTEWGGARKGIHLSFLFQKEQNKNKQKKRTSTYKGSLGTCTAH
jgi:hypothetical protein